MLISAQKRFLLVHIQKTAGSSLHEALRNAIPDLDSFQGTHDHAAWARPHLGKQWDSYYKAAFVRNPWERLVSWYSMIRAQPEVPFRLWRYVHERSASFEEFLDRCTEPIDDVDGRKCFLYNQLDYVSDERGQVIVDFIGRYENLQADTRLLFAQLGLEWTALPHVRRSHHRHYSAHYTERTRSLVAQRYRRDIDHFGYTFDRAAVA